MSTRGGTRNEELKVEVARGRNVFLIFGCPPSKSVPRETKIYQQFFEIIEQAKAENGCILLPDFANVFNEWKPNGQEERKSGEKLLIMT